MNYVIKARPESPNAEGEAVEGREALVGRMTDLSGRPRGKMAEVLDLLPRGGRRRVFVAAGRGSTWRRLHGTHGFIVERLDPADAPPRGHALAVGQRARLTVGVGEVDALTVEVEAVREDGTLVLQLGGVNCRLVGHEPGRYDLVPLGGGDPEDEPS